MKKIVIGAALALATGSAIAADHEYDDRWLLTPNVSFVKPDTDKLSNSGLSAGLSIGKFVSERISVDFELDNMRLDLKKGGSNRQLGYGLMGRYHFDENTGFRPYLGLGLGALKHEGPDATDATMSFAAGLSKYLTDKVRLRTELKYRLENSNDRASGEDTFGDIMFNAGLSIAMGESSHQNTKTNLVDQAPQTDSDGDGVSDANDRCPRTPKGTKVDARGCALAKTNPSKDGDNDRDGVPNSRDVCPHSKAGAVVGRDGCEVKVVIELQGVHFDTDKATLKPESIAILNAAVKTLGAHGNIRVEVAGHTDSRATDAYNQALSQRRSKVVYNYLKSHGIAADRMTWRGYGESQPIATNDTANGRAKNRRTELNVK